MTTIHWQSFGQMDSLRRQIDEVFGDFVRTIDESRKAKWWPNVELVDTPDHFCLQAQLPGIDRDSLDIQVTQQAVLITGERPSPQPSDRETYLHSDFAYGHFRRVINLPAEINLEQIQAGLQDGILTLTLPKADHARRRIVKIQVNETAGGKKELERSPQPPVLDVASEEIARDR